MSSTSAMTRYKCQLVARKQECWGKGAGLGVPQSNCCGLTGLYTSSGSTHRKKLCTCASDVQCVQIMQYKPQRASFDLGKRNLCQAALLQAPKKQTPEIIGPGRQKRPIGLHSAVTANEGDVSEAAAIQQLTAILDQLQVVW